MTTTEARADKTLKASTIAVVALSVIGLLGVLVFGLPSPDGRPKVYELYLAGFWALIAIAHVGTYLRFKQAPWVRRIFSLVAPLMALLYLQKYFWG